EGLSKVARHRLVYDALHEMMPQDIHALAMTLLTPGEAANG
nr:BolA family transcriptional regulator [Oxalobacteraceae bacterium]